MKKIKCKYYSLGWNPETEKNDLPGYCTISGSPCEVDPDRAENCERNIENELIAKEYGIDSI